MKSMNVMNVMNERNKRFSYSANILFMICAEVFLFCLLPRVTLFIATGDLDVDEFMYIVFMMNFDTLL